MIYYKIMKRGLKNKYSLSEIRSLVCEALDVSVDELLNYDRRRKIVDARKIYSFMAKRNNNDETLRKIGECINRHHSSVVYLLKSYNNLIVVDRNFKNKSILVNKKITL